MRTATAIALCCFVSLSLVGCSTETSGDIEIVFAAGNDPSGATEALVDEYNAAHPGVLVKFQAMPANTDTQHDAYVTYLSARESNIDLYSLDVIWTAEFARAGWIVALPDGYIQTRRVPSGTDRERDLRRQALRRAVVHRRRASSTTARTCWRKRGSRSRRRGRTSATACRDDRRTRGDGGLRLAGRPLRGTRLQLPRVPLERWRRPGPGTLDGTPAVAERNIAEALGLMLASSRAASHRTAC